MGTLKDEIRFFNTAYPKLRKFVRGALDREFKKLRDEIARKTPSDSGKLSKSWRVNKTRKANVIASGSIHNPVSYAEALELGVSVSEHPTHSWVRSYKKPPISPGIVYSKGRIWSAKAVGGTMLTVFTPGYHQKLSNRLADAAIMVFR